MSANETVLPGERLRRAREEKGLSQEEACKHLRLSSSYMRALEQDDYERLPEAPFIKGYLRNYARFLGLPAEELARQFQQRVDEMRQDEREREQAALDEAPSNLAVAARYVLSPKIFDALVRTRPGKSNEIQLTDAIRDLIAGGGKVLGMRLAPGERRYDIGNFESYFRAFVEFALADPSYGNALREHVKRLVREE